MNAARALAAAAVALVCCAQASPLPASPPSGDQILGRAKEVFRAHVRPPYVVYTVTRRDRRSGLPDLENSYVLKIWCRTADRAALTRRVWNGEPYGGLINLTVAFDGMVDPGPPTADVFERGLYAAATPPPVEPVPADSPLPIIGSVRVQRDYDYRVRRVQPDGDAWHLWLEPRRDPRRNRIDELWVDATTYELRRMRVRDHLYFGVMGYVLDDEFDVRFELRDGLPLIASIHGQTDRGEYETDYTYGDLSFPDSLPAWYFDPASYGKHRSDPLP